MGTVSACVAEASVYHCTKHWMHQVEGEEEGYFILHLFLHYKPKSLSWPCSQQTEILTHKHTHTHTQTNKQTNKVHADLMYVRGVLLHWQQRLGEIYRSSKIMIVYIISLSPKTYWNQSSCKTAWVCSVLSPVFHLWDKLHLLRNKLN